MSTDFGKVGPVALTRFWGGPGLGVMMQLTGPLPGGWVEFTKPQWEQLKRRVDIALCCESPPEVPVRRESEAAAYQRLRRTLKKEMAASQRHQQRLARMQRMMPSATHLHSGRDYHRDNISRLQRMLNEFKQENGND